ncbi:ribosome silencing factor [Kordiimonas aquimaris]|uniref:ribosome silencing factor n=1 Tax=Kordiimonas aquimaris TaxID=707591 RepID=UPI0021CEFB78|nr:ribosome silencing factor [Kordiimonas aquimaris]
MHASSETPSVTDPVPAIKAEDLLKSVISSLDDNKAEDITSIDLAGKTGIADYMVIANGRSQRQVSALTDYVVKDLKAMGLKGIVVQGLEQADWVLIDAGDVIVHVFRPEVRTFYNLDKMWSTDIEAGADSADDEVIDPALLN